MGPKGYFTAAACVALAAVAGLTVLLTTGHSPGHAKVIKAAEPPVPVSAIPSPHPGKRLRKVTKRTSGPLSTTAPRGTGLGAPDHLIGRPRFGTVTLQWYAVAHAAGYVIYRDGQNVGQTTGLIFDDTGLRNGQ